MRIGIRTTAQCVTGGLGVIAALVAAPSALADPQDPAPPTPAAQAASQAVPGDPSQPAGVPHLSSPENLPPGTTNTPAPGTDGPRMSYLRELWHAVHDHDLSKEEALLLLTQRPLDANAAPPPGLAANPQAPPSAPPPGLAANPQAPPAAQPPIP